MASTRDKRMKTDSPTPAHPSESTTPTTKTSSAIKLKRMSRSRSGMLSSGKLENEDENDSVGLSEDTVSSTASTDVVAKAANTRAKRQIAKEEKELESNGDTKGEEDNKESKGTESPGKRGTKSQVLKSKAANLTSAMARRSAMLKRTSLPLPVKASLRNLSRRSSGAKLNDNSKVKEETTISPKKGKGARKTIETKEPEEEEQMEVEHEEKTESSQDTDLHLEIKQEKIDPKSNDIQNIRRSTRQRKSTIKDRDSPFTRRSQARDKSESKRDSVSPALSSTSIKTEKDSAKAITILVETTESGVEKDQSLSPELVSEELDTESVQHLYDKPDFLENNLGIEKDPKLGEIVKVQEKTKTIVETALITVVMKKDEDGSIKKEQDKEKEEDVKSENINVNKEDMIEEKEELPKEKDEKNKVEEDKENVQQIENKKLDKKVEVVEKIQEIVETDIKESEKSEEVIKSDEKPQEKIEMEVEETEKIEEIKNVDVDIQKDDLKEKQIIEQVNGEKMEIDEPNETKQTDKAESIEENKDEKKESENEKEEIKQDILNDIKEEKPGKIEESEENKENNVESSVKSIGSNSPRSDDCLKIMSEINTPKNELDENAELSKIKENHFKSLGLFTHKAAEEAKIAKQKRKEELALQAAQQSNRKSKKESNDYHSGSGKTSGTLKTIIKLPRTDKEKRKTRMPLKITFQKKNRDKDANGSSNSAENSFYTIQNEVIYSNSIEYLNNNRLTQRFSFNL